MVTELDFGDIDAETGDSTSIETWIAALPPSPPRTRYLEDISLLKLWLNGQPWNEFAIGFESPARPGSQDILMARAEISGDAAGTGGFAFRCFGEDAFLQAMESLQWLSESSARLLRVTTEEPQIVDPNDGLRSMLRADMSGFSKGLDPTEIECRATDLVAAISRINPTFSASLQGTALAGFATATWRQALDAGLTESAKELERILFAIARGESEKENNSVEKNVEAVFGKAVLALKLAGTLPGKYVLPKGALSALKHARTIHGHFAQDTDHSINREPLPRGAISPDDRLFFHDIITQALHLSHECANGLLPSALKETLGQMRLAQIFRVGLETDEVLIAFDDVFHEEPLTPLQDYAEKCQTIYEKRHSDSPAPSL